MRYQDILPDVLKGKWVRQEESAEWMKMNTFGHFHYNKGTDPPIVNRKDYERDTWEVKPDEPEEIYVWGVSRKCFGDIVTSFLSTEKEAVTADPVPTPLTVAVCRENVFSLGKPQKYKLIPVDEDLQFSTSKKRGETDIYMDGRKDMWKAFAENLSKLSFSGAVDLVLTDMINGLKPNS